MFSASIGIIDSGIGGLAVMKELLKVAHGETFVYCGDNKNVPYGDKTEGELLSLAFKSAMLISPFNPKCIVLGCNTLSLTVRKRLEDLVGVPVVGVFPPVESGLISGRKIALLATERTCEFYLRSPLREKVKVMQQKRLAGEIEKAKTDLSLLSDGRNLINPDLQGEKNFNRFDEVVLGCTHYEFIKNRLIFTLLTTKVSSGIANTVKMLEKMHLIDANPKNRAENKVFFVGDSKTENQKFFLNLCKIPS